jgi:hypothetical protein
MWFSSVRSGVKAKSLALWQLEARGLSMALRLVSITASIVLALGFGFGSSAPAVAGNKGAAIAGGIIAGAAIGAAVSSSINQPKTVYVPVPVAAPPPPQWQQVFSPIPHMNCYPAQRACYNANGAYNANWTYKIYAR